MQLVSRTIQDGRRWTAVMMMALLLGGLWIWLSAVPDSATTGGQAPSLREGFPAPDFTLDTLEGEQLTLSEFRGKVVMVNL